MALVEGSTVTATTTGASNHIHLPAGEHVLQVTSSSWGDADLQIGDGTTFYDATDSSGVVNLTADKAYRGPGGMSYRLDVNTYSADIVLKAFRLDRP